MLERTDEEVPSIRSISRILKRAGKVRKRRAEVPNRASTKAPTIEIQGANDLWSVDFKGWWNSKDGSGCEPLTVRDAYSRFVLAAKLMTQSDEYAVKTEFERLFERFGLPVAILGRQRPTLWQYKGQARPDGCCPSESARAPSGQRRSRTNALGRAL